MATNVATNHQSLKMMNFRSIWILIIIDALLLGSILTGLSFDGTILNILSKITLLTSTAGIGIILVKFMNEIIPSHIKAILVFWRVHHVLPGHRAFSELANRDVRIDINVLQKKLGELPVNPDAQNKLWYRIYKKNEHDIRVQEAHRNYLLFRDCTSLTLIIAMIAIIFAIVIKAIISQWLFIILLVVVQFLLCALSARNTGIRFVQNVLAAECSKACEQKF